MTFERDKINWLAFGLFVQARRKHLGLSVKELADMVGQTWQRIDRAERQRNIKEVGFRALCDWMGDPPELFLRRAE